MITRLFDATFWLAAPFWALMILAPRWSVTRRVMASPWVTLLPLAVYFTLAVPYLGALWPVVSRPELEPLRDYLGTPYGAATIWAQLIAFDLFIGRWMYLRGRELPAPLVSVILFLTILLSPFGLVIFLVARSVHRWRAERISRLSTMGS